MHNTNTYLLLNENEGDEGLPLKNVSAITYAHVCSFSLFKATFLLILLAIFYYWVIECNKQVNFVQYTWLYSCFVKGIYHFHYKHLYVIHQNKQHLRRTLISSNFLQGNFKSSTTRVFIEEHWVSCNESSRDERVACERSWHCLWALPYLLGYKTEKKQCVSFHYLVINTATPGLQWSVATL